MGTIVRWCVTDATVFSRVARTRYPMELGGGKILVQLHFPGIRFYRAFQASLGVNEILLPSLKAPGARLPQKVKNWLTARGITIDPGDEVVNLLRKVRDALGIDFKTIDISNET